MRLSCNGRRAKTLNWDAVLLLKYKAGEAFFLKRKKI
jgi:hypothetical protein